MEEVADDGVGEGRDVHANALFHLPVFHDEAGGILDDAFVGCPRDREKVRVGTTCFRKGGGDVRERVNEGLDYETA